MTHGNLTQASRFYKPRSSFKSLRAVLTGFGLLVIAGGCLLFAQQTTGLIMAGFFGGVWIYMLMQTLAVGSGYWLAREGVVLQRFYRQRCIPYDRISTVKLLPESEIASLVEAYQHEQGETRHNIFRAGNRLNQLIEYCTVPLSFSRKRPKAGNEKRPDFVCLSLHAGQSYLISPQTPQVMAHALESMLAG